MRGKLSDRRALEAHRIRISPPRPGRYKHTTYALRMTVAGEAFTVNMPNLGNRWYFSNGKRGGMRRRYEPYEVSR